MLEVVSVTMGIPGISLGCVMLAASMHCLSLCRGRIVAWCYSQWIGALSTHGALAPAACRRCGYVLTWHHCQCSSCLLISVV